MIKQNGADEAAEAKQSQFLERTLFDRRTLTLFGEINTEVAQRTAERLRGGLTMGMVRVVRLD